MGNKKIEEAIDMLLEVCDKEAEGSKDIGDWELGGQIKGGYEIVREDIDIMGAGVEKVWDALKWGRSLDGSVRTKTFCREALGSLAELYFLLGILNKRGGDK